ncbi:Uncharacterised protein [Mycobacteroides abscessus subsp. abscessus]|nr:Uncharacterised protein [Mycobacteroides abscessus subsp. abscessus]
MGSCVAAESVRNSILRRMECWYACQVRAAQDDAQECAWPLGIGQRLGWSVAVTLGSGIDGRRPLLCWGHRRWPCRQGDGPRWQRWCSVRSGVGRGVGLGPGCRPGTFGTGWSIHLPMPYSYADLRWPSGLSQGGATMAVMSDQQAMVVLSTVGGRTFCFTSGIVSALSTNWEGLEVAARGSEHRSIFTLIGTEDVLDRRLASLCRTCCYQGPYCGHLGPGSTLSIPESILDGLKITHCSIMPAPPKPARQQQQPTYVMVPQQDDFDRAMDLFMKFASMSFPEFPPS